MKNHTFLFFCLNIFIGYSMYIHKNHVLVMSAANVDEFGEIFIIYTTGATPH